MSVFSALNPTKRELRQLFAPTKRAVAAYGREVGGALRQYGRSTVKIERNLSKIKRQLIREGSLTPEQVVAIEQRAAASVRDI